MNNLGYRKNRVKVSNDIEQTIIELVTQEKDFEIKKKHPAKWYRGEVAKLLSITDNDNPSLRSYEEKLRVIRAGLKKRNLIDGVWCTGTSVKYSISHEVLPILIDIQKIRSAPLLALTIREALWISRLHPIIEKVAEIIVPDDISGRTKHLLQMAAISLISTQYAWLERCAEIMGQPYPDTTQLDEMYFLRETPADPMEGLIFTSKVRQDVESLHKINMNEDMEKDMEREIKRILRGSQ